MSAPGPTIMLVAHHGQAARYLLRTDVLPTLLAGGARVVVVAPNADEPYMVEEFGGRENVVLENLRPVPQRHDPLSWLIRFTLTRLRRYGVANGHRSRAFKNKYDGFRAQQKGRSKVLVSVLHLGVLALWRSAALRRAALAIETRLFTPDAHAELFDRYAPDLVVGGSPGIFNADMHLLREARRRGVPTAAIVLGWDNPTSKGYRGADVDEVVVWSDRMAEQMATYQDVPAVRCFVGGVPFFDPYLRDGVLPDRAELFDHHVLDPRRKLVVFATSSPGLWDLNEPIAETLAKAIAGDALGAPTQLVIRVHPNYLRPGERPVDGYREIAERYDHVALDVPEVRSETLRIDRSADDGRWMGALFKHADVLVNVFSTTTLEAFILDTPVVLVAEEISLDGGSAGRGWGEFDHLRALVDADAATTVRRLEELPDQVRSALADPGGRSAARRQIAEEECGPLDGRSGERVGRRLLELAGVTDPVPEPVPVP